MPTFYFTARDPSGESVDGEIEDQNKPIALGRLKNRGFTHIVITPNPLTLGDKGANIFAIIGFLLPFLGLGAVFLLDAFLKSSSSIFDMVMIGSLLLSVLFTVIGLLNRHRYTSFNGLAKFTMMLYVLALFGAVRKILRNY